MTEKTQKKVAIIGFGKMGESLALGLVQSGRHRSGEFVCTVGHCDSKDRIVRLGMQVGESNAQAVADADVILLTIKPSVVPQVLADIRSVVQKNQLLISIAAGVTTRSIEAALTEHVPVVRAMPNTPALVGKGITVFCGGKYSEHHHLQEAKTIFESVGAAIALDEMHMDAATGLSGSGPAYVFLIMEALTEAGVKVGISREISRKLVAHTVEGAAALMLKTNQHPALLKDDVTTPAGCTIDGLVALEKGGVRTSLIDAVVQATLRSRHLSGNLET